MRRSVLLLASTSAAALFIAACSSSSGTGTNGGPTAGNTPVVISDKVNVATPTDIDDVTVATDRLTFPAATHPDLLKRVAGDILVGDPKAGSTTNPRGYLRKVVSVASDGTNIVVMTTPALLNEAVRQGQFKGTLQSPTLGLKGPVMSQSVRGGELRPLTNGPMVDAPLTLLDFSGQDIFRGSGTVNLLENPPKTIGFDAHATFTKATLTFTPSFDVGADIQLDLSNILGSIHEFHVIATGQLDADVEVDVALKLTGNATGADLTQLIAQRVFQAQSKTLVDYPINLGALTVGPLNIPVSADFKTTLDCSFNWGGNAEVDVGGVASASVTAGFRYDPTSGMQPVGSHMQSFTQVGPTWTLNGEVGARCTLKPEFDLKFWDIAAAEIWAEPYVALRADAACNNAALTGQVSGEAYAGVSATAHAKVDIFGLYTWEKLCTLFALDSPHASFSETFPLPGGMNASCTPPPAAPPPLDQESPPASCFGDGSGPNAPPLADAGLNPVSNDDGGNTTTGDDGGTTTTGNDGGTSTTCTITPESPPGGWTCDPSKYGDCVCDCNCGATDRDCASGQCGACDHDTCTLGDALGTSCMLDGQGGACIQSICANDSYCCEFSWSASCVAHITNGDYACTQKTCP